MENEKINIGIISNQKAADIAKVSKQAIYDLKKKGNWKFFTEKGKVDTSHPDWEKYINRKDKESESKRQKDISREQIAKIANGLVRDQENEENEDIDDDMESDEQENYLTGGNNPDNFASTEIKDVLTKTKIREMELKMELHLGTLIKRDMVISALSEMNQAIRSHFIDLPRKISALVCQKLDRVGQEKLIEEIMQPLIQKGIQDVKQKAKDVLEVKYDK